ncbi:MAG: glycosyltransferase family 2 protein [Deltaproteobacteria bacterium]|nr:glycosyltransferase family 2 protein [Deltaproteobacteria bacterium]
MQVSVVIPTYNRLDFLKEALASVYLQTGLSYEVIVVDDGSQDGTWEYLQELNYQGLKIFRQDCRGPAAARNLGVSQSRGTWISFLDSDDLWKPNKLKVQLDFLEKNPKYQFCQTEEIWLRCGQRIFPKKHHAKPSGEIFIPSLKLCLVSPSAVMIKKDFFESLGGFDESFEVCEDYELWLRASLRSPFKTLMQALVIKRGGHSDQLSLKHWGMDRFRVREMEKILQTQNLDLNQREALLKEMDLKLSILAQGFAKRYPKANNPYQEKQAWVIQQIQ